MSRSNSLTRRFVLKSTLAGSAASYLVPLLPQALAAPRSAVQSPNERIQLGIIGIGPRCTYDVKAILPFADVRSPVAIRTASISLRSRSSRKSE